MIGFSPAVRRILWVSVFGIAFAFVESSVVVYLRALYYPEGFSLPLKVITSQHLSVELAREVATIVMLVVVGFLVGAKAWEKFAYFLIVFGVWDVFYYLWLKLVLGWPASLGDWDILFLIPLPWIGPVVAPMLISLLMVVCGVIIVIRLERNSFFRPRGLSWLLSSIGTSFVLYSFMNDTQATLHGQQPAPYNYVLLTASLILYIISFVIACRPGSSMAAN